MINSPYKWRPTLSRKAAKRAEYSKKHPPLRCAACRADGTLYKVEDKYFCRDCHAAILAGRRKFNL